MVSVVIAFAAAAIVWTGCEHRPRVRPSSIVTACADANFYVDHLRWKTWGPRAATATGVAHYNDCNPNCAGGHFHTFAATVRLSKVVTCVPGRREFARVEYSGKQHGAETLPCAFLRLKP